VFSALALSLSLGCARHEASASAGRLQKDLDKPDAPQSRSLVAPHEVLPELPKIASNFELPAKVDLKRIVELDVPNDYRVRVLHAASPVTRAIVYLHGMCSSSSPANEWAPDAARFGTLVLLRAETPCGDRPGNKWTKDPAQLQARIDRALDAVRAARGGHLDTQNLGIIGYSQGAHRAEVLAAAYPARYPNVVLGGPPEAALPEHFQSARRVAVLGGELENSDHMRLGAERLRTNDIEARFFVLPHAYHGDYGPEGVRVMQTVLAWVFEEDSR
jgi:dienelactone hydrolase